MKLNLLELLRPNHIRLHLQAADGFDAVRLLTEPLVESGHAEPAFAEDVWAREETFPTGLPTQPHAVAIPHADPDHVHQSAVCFGTLTAPVSFAQMGTDGSTTLAVQVIILLAIKEREKQAELIQQVVKLIQDGDLLTELLKAEDVDQAYQLIQSALRDRPA